jgi:hypothetical protein
MNSCVMCSSRSCDSAVCAAPEFGDCQAMIKLAARVAPSFLSFHTTLLLFKDRAAYRRAESYSCFSHSLGRLPHVCKRCRDLGHHSRSRLGLKSNGLRVSIKED